VHESRNGRGSLPWAQRLDLGWVIIGEACLDGAHKPDEVSTFKTQLLHNGRPSTLEPCPNVINVQSTFRQCSNHQTDHNNEAFVEERFDDGLGRNVFAVSKDDNKPGLSIEDRQFINMMEENMVKNGQPLCHLDTKLENYQKVAKQPASVLKTHVGYWNADQKRSSTILSL
jgi:hypothetical protein